VQEYGSLAKIPATTVGNTRNDMYLASEAIRFLLKARKRSLQAAGRHAERFKGSLDNATKFIPTWSRSRSPSR